MKMNFRASTLTSNGAQMYIQEKIQQGLERGRFMLISKKYFTSGSGQQK